MDSFVVIRVALFVTDVIAKAVFVIVLLIWRIYSLYFLLI